MRIKKGFVLRELAGEKIVSGEGLEQLDFNKIVSLNTSAAYIWEHSIWRQWLIYCWTDMISNEVLRFRMHVVFLMTGYQ